MKKGKLIVIDGTDGSGKATQTKLLVRRLQKHGHKVRIEDFPQYGKKSAGPVEDYLNGLYGSAADLGAYIPSILYAVDRFAAKKRIEKHLSDGFTVIANRYVAANLAHQGGKINDRKKREGFFKWLLALEYDFFKIPKPDLQIILHVSTQVALKLVKQKGPRFYIGNRKLDIHEKDSKHIDNASNVYMELAKKFNYPVVDAMENGNLLDPQIINDKLFAIVKKHV